MNLLQKPLAEFIGTFVLVFSGCGSLMIAERFPESFPLFLVPIVFGLAVLIMVYAVGHISGAHFNPSVTIAFAVARHFPFKEIWLYCCAQIAGAFGAIFLLSLILPRGEIFGATVPVVLGYQAVVWEFLLTFFLMFVITSVATDTRAVGAMAGVAIGAAIMLCAWIGGAVTGASMNPARSIAPAFFQNEISSLWIYIVGPIFGAIAGALFYQSIRCEKNEIKNTAGCC